jgi:hypothetical protein
MKSFFRFLLFATVVFGRLAATDAWAGTPAVPLPEWHVSLDDVGIESRQERAVHFETGDVVVDGRLSFEPEEQMLRLEGTYRTKQVLDPRVKLSYLLLAADGRMLQLDGLRFDWCVGADGVREARFALGYSLAKVPGLRPVLRVQFNYVVEHEYWNRTRHPEMALPELMVSGPCQRAYFTVRRAWIPPVLPMDTVSWLPAWIEAEYNGKPAPYMAAADVRAGERHERVEAPRLPLASQRGGGELVLYRLGEMRAGWIWIRPGFVWDGVEWFDRFEGNPYRRVLLVGPLVYAVGLTLAGLGLWLGARQLRRVPMRWLRLLGYGTVGLVALAMLGLASVSCHLLLAAGLATIWVLQRRVAAPGPRAYWTTWAFLVLLELYWGHAGIRTGGLWTGTVLSICAAALILLPLRWIKRPTPAAWAVAGIGFMATLTATAMVVYYDFFRDYPGLRDLLYSGQVGDVGDSLGALIGQRHLVPWWWLLCCVPGLWRR